MGKVDYASLAPTGSTTSGKTPAKFAKGDATIASATKDLLRQLNAGHTEEFKRALAFFGKLHRYSMFNSYLIMRAKPDAEVVAGYARWQELGRQVRQGATGAIILVPVLSRKQEGEDETERRLLGFTTGRVFSDKDLVDIETNPLPSPFRNLPDDAQELYELLRSRIVAATGYSFEEKSYFYNGALGVCDHGRQRISVLQNLPSQRKCMVALHECVHALYHGDRAPGVSERRKEFEAESIGFVLASVCGLTNPNSADYLMAWKGSADDLKQSMTTIQRMSRAVLQKLALEETPAIAAD